MSSWFSGSRTGCGLADLTLLMLTPLGLSLGSLVTKSLYVSFYMPVFARTNLPTKQRIDQLRTDEYSSQLLLLVEVLIWLSKREREGGAKRSYCSRLLVHLYLVIVIHFDTGQICYTRAWGPWYTRVCLDCVRLNSREIKSSSAGNATKYRVVFKVALCTEKIATDNTTMIKRDTMGLLRHSSHLRRRDILAK